MSLSSTRIENAKPKSKPYKLADEKGLFLLIQPNGGKWWRYKYRFAGKEKSLAIGIYPEVSLKDARQRHFEARQLLASGVDPGAAKQQVKRAGRQAASSSFKSIALEWYGQNLHAWTPHYAQDVKQRLEKHMFPHLGNRAISEITAPELLDVLQIIEKTGALDMAQRMLQTCNPIFNYAIRTSRAAQNIDKSV